MKKVIISIIIILFLLISVCFGIMYYNIDKEPDSTKYQSTADEKIELSIEFDRVVDDEKYESISSYIKQIADVPDGYNRIAKLNLHLNNPSSLSFYGFRSDINTDNIFMVSECVDTETMDPIYPKSELDVITYVYLNDNLKDEEDIKNALRKTNFEFLFFIDNRNDLMNPYKIYVKADWQ